MSPGPPHGRACSLTSAGGSVSVLFHFLRIKLQYRMYFFKLLMFSRAPDTPLPEEGPQQGSWQTWPLREGGPKARAVGGQRVGRECHRGPGSSQVTEKYGLFLFCTAFVIYTRQFNVEKLETPAAQENCPCSLHPGIC